MKRLLVFSCILLANLSAHAEDAGGNKLLKGCNAAVRFIDDGNIANSRAIDAAFCLGLVQGVVSTNQLYQVLVHEKTLFCSPPTGVTNEQAARIVAKYLQNNPQELHERDSFLVVSAMRDAFPCPAS